jgi:ABC-type multidrug transport system ATPase subunit
LTIKETLEFAAELRMKCSKEEKEKKVKNIIKMLSLERVQNTYIGGKFLKGISGGERKRTSIGFELACEPQGNIFRKILFKKKSKKKIYLHFFF